MPIPKVDLIVYSGRLGNDDKEEAQHICESRVVCCTKSIAQDVRSMSFPRTHKAYLEVLSQTEAEYVLLYYIGDVKPPSAATVAAFTSTNLSSATTDATTSQAASLVAFVEPGADHIAVKSSLLGDTISTLAQRRASVSKTVLVMIVDNCVFRDRPARKCLKEVVLKAELAKLSKAYENVEATLFFPTGVTLNGDSGSDSDDSADFDTTIPRFHSFFLEALREAMMDQARGQPLSMSAVSMASLPHPFEETLLSSKFHRAVHSHYGTVTKRLKSTMRLGHVCSDRGIISTPIWAFRLRPLPLPHEEMLLPQRKAWNDDPELSKQALRDIRDATHKTPLHELKQQLADPTVASSATPSTSLHSNATHSYHHTGDAEGTTASAFPILEDNDDSESILSPPSTKAANVVHLGEFMKDMSDHRPAPRPDIQRYDPNLPLPPPRKKTGASRSCPVCNVEVSGEQNWEMHLRSEKHRRKEALQQAGGDPNLAAKLLNAENFFHCRVCNVAISGKTNVRQHLEGDRHKKNCERHLALRQQLTGGGEAAPPQQHHPPKSTLPPAPPTAPVPSAKLPLSGGVTVTTPHSVHPPHHHQQYHQYATAFSNNSAASPSSNNNSHPPNPTLNPGRLPW